MSKGLPRALTAIGLIAAIGLALLFRDRLDTAALEAWLAGAGAAGPLLFVAIYTVAAALFLPGAALPRLVARLRARPMLGIEELKRRLDGRQDMLLLDVRTAADFVGEQGHIAGATNIPLEALEAGLEELAADLERPIALVCRTDRRSAKAAALLTRRGFADVHVVQGGMTAWLDNGWPVEDAKPKPE